MLKLEEVETLNDILAERYANTPATSEGITLSVKTVEEILECVIWTKVQLEQRKINSRAYLAKQKIKDRLLREHLSPDELRSIDEQARRAAEDKG